MTSWAKNAHGTAIIVMAIGVIAATSVGFTQSWAGLYGWGTDHGLTHWKAISFPAMVDTFIIIGELGLFALALEGHQLKRGLAWADLLLPLLLASAGWADSVLFNIGHVHGAWQNKLTAAVPPVASMLGLFVLLRTLHRLVQNSGQPVSEPSDETSHEDPDPGHDPGQPDADQTAAPRPVTDFRTAVISLWWNGKSYREIADALKVKKWRVEEVLTPLAKPDGGQPGQLQTASLNGHHPDGVPAEGP